MKCIKTAADWKQYDWVDNEDVFVPLTQAELDKLDAFYEAMILTIPNFVEEDITLISFDLYESDLAPDDATCQCGMFNYRITDTLEHKQFKF